MGPDPRIDELQKKLERDYVSVGEVAIWLVGVVLVLVGLHFFFIYWGYDLFRPKRDAGAAPRLLDRETSRVWSGRYAEGGHALLRVAYDTEQAAEFRDKALEAALGRPVTSYWLSLYAFDAKTPALSLDWSRATAVARMGAKEVKNLPLPDPARLPARHRVQIQPLVGPLILAPGQETRCLVLFPRHDPKAMEQVELRWPGGACVLKRIERPSLALEAFLDAPTREFFESAHVDPAARGAAKKK